MAGLATPKIRKNMQAFAKLNPVPFSELQSAALYAEKYKVDRQFGKVIRKLYGKTDNLPKDLRCTVISDGFYKFVNFLKKACRYSPDNLPYLHWLEIDENGWVLVDRVRMAEVIGAKCVTTVTRYLQKLETFGIIERKLETDTAGRYYSWFRFRWDNFIRLCKGEEVQDWVRSPRGMKSSEECDKMLKNFGKFRQFPENSVAEPTALTTPVPCTVSKSGDDIFHGSKEETETTKKGDRESAREEKSVLKKDCHGSTKAPKEHLHGSRCEEMKSDKKTLIPGDRYHGSESKYESLGLKEDYQEVIETLRFIYPVEEWTLKQKSKLARWVRHTMPIYQLTIELAREIVNCPNEFFNGDAPPLDLFLKRWPRLAREWYKHTQLESMVEAGRGALEVDARLDADLEAATETVVTQKLVGEDVQDVAELIYRDAPRVVLMNKLLRKVPIPMDLITRVKETLSPLSYAAMHKLIPGIRDLLGLSLKQSMDLQYQATQEKWLARMWVSVGELFNVS